MKENELYLITNKYFVDHGRDIQSCIIVIDKVEICRKLCSGHDKGGFGCIDQQISYHILYEPSQQYYDCGNHLESNVRKLPDKPENLFEIY